MSAVGRRCNRVFLHPTRFHRRVRIRTREERRLEPHRSRKERMFEILRVETNPSGQAKRCSARVNFQSGGEEIGREETGR